MTNEKQAEEEKIPDVPSSDVPQGVLPRIIATLVNRRRQVKALMKDKSATPAKLLQVCHYRNFFSLLVIMADAMRSMISSSKLSNSLPTRCTVVLVLLVLDSPRDHWPH